MHRWALTHPLSVKEYENLKKKQMKPDFLDMVPWYSGYGSHLLFILGVFLNVATSHHSEPYYAGDYMLQDVC